MSRIYLASSWRNTNQAGLVSVLRMWGHQVYDFKSRDRMPCGGPVATAFSWAEVDPAWGTWHPRAYRQHVTTSERAASGFLGDFRGMEWADTCVLLLPCGRSAHLEAGYMKGRGKRLIIHFVSDKSNEEPDLMYLMADHITIDNGELAEALG
jgi:hypothetical protein